MIHEYNEMTRGNFVSYMTDYVKQLLKSPLQANVNEFLIQHGIDNQKALSLLLKRRDNDDINSAVLIRKEKIRDNGYDENGKRLKDTFEITYKQPNDGFMKKLKQIYKDLYENSYIVDKNLLNEVCECGDSGNGDATGQYSTPVFGPIKRTLYVTEEQLQYIKESTAGDIGQGFTVPFGNNRDFYKSSLDHKNMMKKSFNGTIDETRK